MAATNAKLAKKPVVLNDISLPLIATLLDRDKLCGYVEGANLRIESASIHGFEWGCDLSPAIAEGVTSYRGEQSCYGDGGDDAPSPIALTLLPDGKLQMQDANGTQTLFRCE